MPTTNIPEALQSRVRPEIHGFPRHEDHFKLVKQEWQNDKSKQDESESEKKRKQVKKNIDDNLKGLRTKWENVMNSKNAVSLMKNVAKLVMPASSSEEPVEQATEKKATAVQSTAQKTDRSSPAPFTIKIHVVDFSFESKPEQNSPVKKDIPKGSSGKDMPVVEEQEDIHVCISIREKKGERGKLPKCRFKVSKAAGGGGNDEGGEEITAEAGRAAEDSDKAKEISHNSKSTEQLKPSQKEEVIEKHTGAPFDFETIEKSGDMEKKRVLRVQLCRRREPKKGEKGAVEPEVVAEDDVDLFDDDAFTQQALNDWKEVEVKVKDPQYRLMDRGAVMLKLRFQSPGDDANQSSAEPAAAGDTGDTGTAVEKAAMAGVESVVDDAAAAAGDKAEGAGAEGAEDKAKGNRAEETAGAEEVGEMWRAVAKGQDEDPDVAEIKRKVQEKDPSVAGKYFLINNILLQKLPSKKHAAAAAADPDKMTEEEREHWAEQLLMAARVEAAGLELMAKTKGSGSRPHSKARAAEPAPGDGRRPSESSGGALPGMPTLGWPQGSDSERDAPQLAWCSFPKW